MNYTSSFDSAMYLISLFQAINDRFRRVNVEPFPFIGDEECRTDRGPAMYDVRIGLASLNAAAVLQRFNATRGDQHKLAYLCSEAGIPQGDVYSALTNMPEVKAATDAAAAKILKG